MKFNDGLAERTGGSNNGFETSLIQQVAVDFLDTDCQQFFLVVGHSIEQLSLCKTMKRASLEVL